MKMSQEQRAGLKERVDVDLGFGDGLIIQHLLADLEEMEVRLVASEQARQNDCRQVAMQAEILADIRKQLTEAQALVYLYRDALIDGPENMSDVRAEELGMIECDTAALDAAVAEAVAPYKHSTELLAEVALWLHAAYDRPPQMPECVDILRRVDAFLAIDAARASCDAKLAAKEKSNG